MVTRSIYSILDQFTVLTVFKGIMWTVWLFSNIMNTK